MISLIEYIKENNKEDLANNLVNFLQKNLSSVREKDLKKAYNILQTVSDEDYNKLKNDTFKGNNNGLKCLLDILNKVGGKTEFIHLILNKDKSNLPAFKDLVSSSKTLYELVDSALIYNDKEIFDDDTKKDFLNRLLNKDYKDENKKGVGRGELFLFTLFKDTVNPKQGDVLIDGHEIEVKMSSRISSNGARIKSTKNNLKSPLDMNKYLSNIYPDSNIYLGNGADSKQKLIDSLVKDSGKSEKEVFIDVAKTIFYQFSFFDADKDKHPLWDEILKFIEKIKEYNGYNIIRLHGCLALIQYHNDDNWEYLLVGNTVNSKYYIIDSKNCKFDNFYKNLETLFTDKNFIFKDGPYDTSSANNQNYVSTIYVV